MSDQLRETTDALEQIHTAIRDLIDTLNTPPAAPAVPAWLDAGDNVRITYLTNNDEDITCTGTVTFIGSIGIGIVRINGKRVFTPWTAIRSVSHLVEDTTPIATGHD